MKTIFLILAMLAAAALATAAPNDLIITQQNATTGTAQIQTIVPAVASSVLGVSAAGKAITLVPDATNDIVIAPGLLELNPTLTKINSITSAATYDLLFSTGTFGSALDFSSATGDALFYGQTVTIGTGGTGTNIAEFVLNSGNGVNTGSLITFENNSGQISNIGEYPVVIGGGSGTDMVYQSAGEAYFYTHAGTLSKLALTLDNSQNAIFSGQIQSSVSAFMLASGVSTSARYAQIENTTGDLLLGVEGSSPSLVATNGVGYSTVLTSVAGGLVLGTAQSAAVSFDSSQNATFYGPISEHTAAQVAQTNQNLTPAAVALPEAAGATTLSWAAATPSRSHSTRVTP